MQYIPAKKNILRDFAISFCGKLKFVDPSSRHVWGGGSQRVITNKKTFCGSVAAAACAKSDDGAIKQYFLSKKIFFAGK